MTLMNFTKDIKLKVPGAYVVSLKNYCYIKNFKKILVKKEINKKYIGKYFR